MKIKRALPALALAIICSAFLSPQWALADVGEGEAIAPAASSAQEAGESAADDQAQTTSTGQTGEPAAPAQPEAVAPPAQDASAPGDAQDPNAAGAQATEPSDADPEATSEPGQAPEAAPSDDPDSGELPSVSSDDPSQTEPSAQPEAAAPEPGSPEAAGNPSQESTAAEKDEAAKPAADVDLNDQAEPKGTTAKPAASTTAKPQAKPQVKPLAKPQAKPKATTPSASISYTTHVQNIGWQSYVKDGKMAGTSGKGLRLEGIKIIVDSAIKGGVQYQVHVQNIGWQAVMANGTMAGTSGKSYRLEAIRIMLTGDLSRRYDVLYRTHVQNIGWQGWVKNGAMAGTSGKGYRLEGIEVKLQEKAKPAAKPTDGLVGVRYRGHVQNVGWQGMVQDGDTAGTSGQSLRVEAANVYLDRGSLSGGIEYRAHVQNVGWQGWAKNGAMMGTSGRSLRVEAFQVRLTGDIAKDYDVVYRTHVENVGWQNWVLNGQTAGTSGRGLRVEAFQIKLVKKGSNQPISEGTYFIASAANPRAAADVPNATKKPGTQISAHTTNYTNAQRFYVRNEGSGTYSIQSVASGLFLAEKDGKIVQTSDSNAATHRWKANWNAGYALVNAATGKEIALAGGKTANGTGIEGQAVAKKSTHRWTLTRTPLIASGTYTIGCIANGYVLDVANASWEDGANVMVGKANGGGNQAFTVSDTGNDIYRINCAMTGKALATSGSNVQQGGSGSAALWRASLDRKGGIVFVNQANGKTLNAASKVNGANANTAKANGASTQEWQLEPTSYKPDPVLQRAISKARNRSSNTGYFITVDLSNHRVVVFQGRKGSWTPIKNWTVSNGAPGTPTVVGDYTVGIKGYSFGSGYTCYYYTQFYGDYLFHSVLYYQGTRRIMDGRLGYAISHGCVRMDINHAKWIYDHIPGGTHVKTYY